jgi:hypothetical protein
VDIKQCTPQQPISQRRNHKENKKLCGGENEKKTKQNKPTTYQCL